LEKSYLQLLSEIINEDADIQAAFLIGSMADGYALEHSDIDVALITKAISAPIYKQLRVGKRSLDLHYYPEDWIDSNGSHYLDLRKLREVSRIAIGRLLYNKSLTLMGIQEVAQKVQLDPLEVKNLLDKIKLGLFTVSNSKLSRTDKIYILQGVVFSCCILGLSITPNRYQKPKWIIRDLKKFGYLDLCHNISLLTGWCDGENEGQRTISLVHEIKKKLIVACDICGLPPLIRDCAAGYEYQHMSRTISDAEDLLILQDFPGAALTANFALRFMYELLKENGIENDVIKKWKDDSFSILPISSLKDFTEILDRIIEECAQHTIEILNDYKKSIKAFNSSLSYEGKRSALLGVSRLTNNLWIGEYQDRVDILKNLGATLVVFVAKEKQFSKQEDLPFEIIQAQLVDEEISGDLIDKAYLVAINIVEHLSEKKGSAVILCNSGYNRSALVAGIVMHNLQKMNGPAICSLISKARAGALSNESFKDHLMSLEI
jgi:predicted nucleotidyltransferase